MEELEDLDTNAGVGDDFRRVITEVVGLAFEGSVSSMSEEMYLYMSAIAVC